MPLCSCSALLSKLQPPALSCSRKAATDASAPRRHRPARRSAILDAAGIPSLLRVRRHLLPGHPGSRAPHARPARFASLIFPTSFQSLEPMIWGKARRDSGADCDCCSGWNMDADVLWPRTALCRVSRLERQGARSDWKGCCCSWTMLLLPPLPLVDSGMVKTTRLHYSMCR